MLVLEDIDMWGAPLIDAASSTEGEGAMFRACRVPRAKPLRLLPRLSRSRHLFLPPWAKLLTKGYLYDLMEPMSVVDIYFARWLERRQIWETIAVRSIRSVQSLDMAMLTKNVAQPFAHRYRDRCREAVEDATAAQV